MMISLSLARQLKAAGLVWQATNNDYFALPDRGMDDRLFVISGMQAQLDVFRGWPVVTFHGTAEWALDYVLTTEAVWMPREDQLRQAILELLAEEAQQKLTLGLKDSVYNCSFSWQGQEIRFEAAAAADAYGKALLFLLNKQEANLTENQV